MWNFFSSERTLIKYHMPWQFFPQIWLDTFLFIQAYCLRDHHHQHWLQKLKRPLAVQLRSSCEKLGELFLCRQLIPAMMKIKGRAKNIDNDTDWSWCVFKNGRRPKTNTILNTLSHSHSFFYLLSINFLNEYILTSEDSARALRTYKNKCTRGN